MTRHSFDFGYVPRPSELRTELSLCEECSDPATHLTAGKKWLCEEHWFSLLESDGGE